MKSSIMSRAVTLGFVLAGSLLLPATELAFGSNLETVIQETQDISFDDVKFPIEKDQTFDRALLTPELLAMEGKTIRIRGFIRPSFKQSGIEKFVLVRDNQECCFGPGAMLYDCMIVTLEKGPATEYTTRAITVEGKFMLKEFEGPDGKIWAIFRLMGARVL